MAIILKISLFLSLFSSSFGETLHGQRFNTRLREYENLCGDLAISCVANCPAFQQHCYNSHIANSIRDTGAEVTPPPPQQQLPESPPNNQPGSGGGSGGCSSFGQLCLMSASDVVHPVGIITGPGTRSGSGCCQGLLCFPFKHDNGALASIGACHRFHN